MKEFCRRTKELEELEDAPPSLADARSLTRKAIGEAVTSALAGKMPSLGDPANVYCVEISEAEVNALHALAGFVFAFYKTAPSGIPRIVLAFIEHYSPTVKDLSERLALLHTERDPDVGILTVQGTWEGRD